jgi:hypothetical protein
MGVNCPVWSFEGTWYLIFLDSSVGRARGC